MTCKYMYKSTVRNADGTRKTITRCYYEKGKYQRCIHPEKCLCYEEKTIRIKGVEYAY